MKITRIFLPLLLAGIFLANPKQLNAQCTGKTRALETIGMQGGLVLYNTYQVIGTMNDGYLKDAWTKETVLGILDEQINMMTNMSAQYDTLGDSKFLTDPSDKESLVTMNNGAKLLKKEASALKDYINDPTDANRDAYKDARDDAWKLIAKFLGFSEDGDK